MVTFAVMTVVALVTSALIRKRKMPKSPGTGTADTGPVSSYQPSYGSQGALPDAAETAVSVISDLLDCGRRASVMTKRDRKKHFFREQKKESL